MTKPPAIYLLVEMVHGLTAYGGFFSPTPALPNKPRYFLCTNIFLHVFVQNISNMFCNLPPPNGSNKRSWIIKLTCNCTQKISHAVTWWFNKLDLEPDAAARHPWMPEVSSGNTGGTSFKSCVTRFLPVLWLLFPCPFFRPLNFNNLTIYRLHIFILINPQPCWCAWALAWVQPTCNNMHNEGRYWQMWDSYFRVYPIHERPLSALDIGSAKILTYFNQDDLFQVVNHDLVTIQWAHQTRLHALF